MLSTLALRPSPLHRRHDQLRLRINAVFVDSPALVFSGSTSCARIDVGAIDQVEIEERS